MNFDRFISKLFGTKKKEVKNKEVKNKTPTLSEFDLKGSSKIEDLETFQQYMERQGRISKTSASERARGLMAARSSGRSSFAPMSSLDYSDLITNMRHYDKPYSPNYTKFSGLNNGRKNNNVNWDYVAERIRFWHNNYIDLKVYLIFVGRKGVQHEKHLIFEKGFHEDFKMNNYIETPNMFIEFEIKGHKKTLECSVRNGESIPKDDKYRSFHNWSDDSLNILYDI